MVALNGNPAEIRELARYELRPEALVQCLAAIHEFVAYVRTTESGAVRYEVWQEAERPTRFVHIFPVEFIEYRQVDANVVSGRS